MTRVNVRASREYEVVIASGLFDTLGESVGRFFEPCKAAIISDDTVFSLYGERVTASLKKGGFSVSAFTFPHGEENKTAATVIEMVDFLANSELTRSDIVVALGGGVVGDMAGFAAAIYLRGISFVNLPTTLLSMVDSAVGGKTGCNLERGKNLVGAFWQPSLVLCDTNALATLSGEHIAEGCAEAIKTGAIADAELFSLLEKGFNIADTGRVIERCVRIKASLVEADERDNASRQLLNFGHTIGHAIEKASGYAVSHGNAVAAGMVYETAAGIALGVSEEESLERIKRALFANLLPVSCGFPSVELAKIALSDKKRKGDTLTVVAPKRIGECVLVNIESDKIEGYFEDAFRG